MPATGTHASMTRDELATMFPGIPSTLFRNHNWRTDIVTRGSLSGQFMEELSEGKLSYSWPVQVNRLVASGKHDLIVSIGQVVPHEVAGMANYTKNILVGTGGAEAIDKSHYLGAVYGMERIMGEVNTPVRRLFNTAAQRVPGRFTPTLRLDCSFAQRERQACLSGNLHRRRRKMFRHGSGIVAIGEYFMVGLPVG